MCSALHVQVFIRPLAIINGKAATEAVGCPKLCPHSPFIPAPQHELYDVHIQPLTIRDQQSALGWDLLFQAINIWSCHPIKYIAPAFHEFSGIAVACSRVWVWSLQLEKYCSAQLQGTVWNRHCSFTQTDEFCFCCSHNFHYFSKTVDTVLSPCFPAGVQGQSSPNARVCCGGRCRMEVRALVSWAPPWQLLPLPGVLQPRALDPLIGPCAGWTTLSLLLLLLCNQILLTYRTCWRCTIYTETMYTETHFLHGDCR